MQREIKNFNERKKEEQMDKRMENKYRQWNGSRATIEYGEETWE